MNIHDVVEQRDIFFQQHWEEYYAIQKYWEEVKKSILHVFLRPKNTFLTIPILVAGTNSVSSGNIVEESFFDKNFAEKLKVPTII
jgi:hypothetical protein